MNWTLEVVVVPVADIDRAKAFYADRLGFNVDHDSRFPNARIVQLTPPGSGCSVVLQEGLGHPMEPGSLHGVQLVVPDIRAAHAQLRERGVDAGEVQVVGPDGMREARDDDDELNNVGFVFFRDPDGNGWAVQQISSRS